MTTNVVESLLAEGQALSAGFICRSQPDPTDVWIVARKVFTNTYSITT